MSIIKASGFFSALAKSRVAQSSAIGAVAGAASSDKGDGVRGAAIGGTVGAVGGMLSKRLPSLQKVPPMQNRTQVATVTPAPESPVKLLR
jgi:hypothetical protein